MVASMLDIVPGGRTGDPCVDSGEYQGVSEGSLVEYWGLHPLHSRLVDSAP